MTNNNPPARLARVQVTMDPAARDKMREIKHAMDPGGRKKMTWDEVVDELHEAYTQGEWGVKQMDGKCGIALATIMRGDSDELEISLARHHPTEFDEFRPLADYIEAADKVLAPGATRNGGDGDD